ncbi:thiol:disulfide interchange protein DsbA/DsbL [Pseudoalteromonas xiamenensis]|uniref:thiol:disulfide interchange protein DsbA/DsbL n=1 Tax=Pseudoalteromonas xiamenensis TaxID=882626 RepID=UPI0027E4146F|nr:thiol:disulfide interchange protein DsbA/DsbL [Pseudoalteromonas xiamenensis]WMN58774.1 thiol:disulfide interchange protein DsbA/DsbL [Pseudoalteromonas xiamenensis]
MLKLVKVALLGLMLPLFAQAAPFVEGDHYEVVSDRASRKPEVVEFFSFYCPHCNTFEKLIADIKPHLDKDVEFKKSHVNFVGVRDPKIQVMLAQALAAAEALPEKDKIIAAIFNHFHGKHAKVNELADVKDIFVAQGVDGDTFDKVFNSFTVRTKAKKMESDQNYYSEKKALTGVPTFIVNGKYKLRLRESKTTEPEQIAALINYLAKMK